MTDELYKRFIIVGLVVVLLFAASYLVYNEMNNYEIEYSRGRLI